MLSRFPPTPLIWGQVVCSHPWGSGSCGQGQSAQTAHAPHRVADPARMHDTECLHRHAHVAEHSRRSCPAPRYLGLRHVADSPKGPWLHTWLARVGRDTEIMKVPRSHVDVRKEKLPVRSFRKSDVLPAPAFPASTGASKDSIGGLHSYCTHELGVMPG